MYCIVLYKCKKRKKLIEYHFLNLKEISNLLHQQLNSKKKFIFMLVKSFLSQYFSFSNKKAFLIVYF